MVRHAHVHLVMVDRAIMPLMTVGAPRVQTRALAIHHRRRLTDGAEIHFESFNGRVLNYKDSTTWNLIGINDVVHIGNI